VTFTAMSGNFRSLHIDEITARKSIFGARIAHGMLVLSIVTGLRARLGLFYQTLLAILGIENWRFTEPVFIGDTVRCESEAIDLRETSKPDLSVVKTYDAGSQPARRPRARGVDRTARQASTR
jgi:acyl dehydratase